MFLKFTGKTREYHPATGLDLVPGVHEYPDEHVEALKATGRLVEDHKAAAKAADREKE